MVGGRRVLMLRHKAFYFTATDVHSLEIDVCKKMFIHSSDGEPALVCCGVLRCRVCCSTSYSFLLSVVLRNVWQMYNVADHIFHDSCILLGLLCFVCHTQVQSRCAVDGSVVEGV